MFLNRLTEDEKKGFLILAKCAAQSNGEFAVEELMILRSYCGEMGIDEAFINMIPDVAMKEVAKGFKVSSEANKRIILFELLGMMHADGTYDAAEKKFINSFAKEIGIKRKTITNLDRMMGEYTELVAHIAEEIFNG